MDSTPTIIKQNKPSSVAEKILNNLEHKHILTAEARQAVLNAACPFPDSPIENSCWPMYLGEQTFPTHFQATGTLGAPSATGWKLHAVLIPTTATSSSAIVRYSMDDSGILTGADTPGNKLGTLSIIAIPEDSAFPVYGTIEWQDAEVFSWSPQDESGLDGMPHRLVGLGLELINTSSTLNKGGMAYAYRLPTVDQSVTFQVSAASNKLTTVRTLTAPPQDVSEVMNRASTYWGEATAGVAVISSPCSLENRPVFEFPSTTVGLYQRNGLDPTRVFTASGDSPVQDWNISGAFVTGLAPDATFTARVIAYVEYFPTLAKSELSSILVGAVHSPVVYSPLALELLSSVYASLPCGFDYRENPFGEWFDKVLKAIAKYAEPIGSALSVVHPAAGILGKAISAGANGVSHVIGAHVPPPARMAPRKGAIPKSLSIATPPQVAAVNNNKTQSKQSKPVPTKGR